MLVEPLRLLTNNEKTINLTKMEYAVLDLLISSTERIVSNDAIAKKLNKNLDHYKGLVMCLSRLQAKFKRSARGDNLFRSVRNRGYCIVQTIHIEKDLSNRHTACDEKTWKRCSPPRHSIYLLADASAYWVDVCSGSGTEEVPSFHEMRALSLHLWKNAGNDGQKIAGHASEGMTKNYQRDHEKIVRPEAIPDLNISEITG